jgi:hypothetical protein
VRFQLCAADTAALAGARGLLVLGPGRAPDAIRIPFSWDFREPERIALPILLDGHTFLRR